jgi:hypothetical protein
LLLARYRLRSLRRILSLRQYLFLSFRPRQLHSHMLLQRVSQIAQIPREILYTSCLLRAPRHPARLRLSPRQILRLVFLALAAKGGERVVSGGVLREVFVFLSCVLLSCIIFTFQSLHLCDLSSCDTPWALMFYPVTVLALVTVFIYSSKVVLPCLTPIPYELYLFVY